MNVLTFEYSGLVESINLHWYLDYLKLRKLTFIDRAGWQLEAEGPYEEDQYDKPGTRYILLIKNTLLAGGMRLVPSKISSCGWSNLLRDSSVGRIKSIKPTIFPKRYNFDGSYECSRLAVNRDHLSKKDVFQAFKSIGDAARQTACDERISQYMSLSPKSFFHGFHQMGFCVERIGQSYLCRDDGREYCIYSLDDPANLVPCLTQSHQG